VTRDDDLAELEPQVIHILCQVLLRDALPSVRQKAAETLGKMAASNRNAINALVKAAISDSDPDVRLSAILGLGEIYSSDRITNQLTDILKTMSDQPKVQMNFNAPVTGVAGNVEGDFVINTEQNFDALFVDFKQFIANLEQQHPQATQETAIQIIEAEFRELEQTQPLRWQNFLNLKRLWNGGKKAAVKVGEHFTEQNPWGKGAIAFLEGVMEEPK
jgi:hypothetical protein